MLPIPAPIKGILEVIQDITDRKSKSGIAAVFKTEEQVLRAAVAMRDRRYKKFDTFTPYPIHGMDDAMGLKPSWVPYCTLIGGLTGTTAALSMMIYMSVIDWPMNVGGKPAFSLPAFIPITFELTILLGGLTTVAVILLGGKVFRPFRKVIDPKITDDHFAIFVPDSEPGYNFEELKRSFQDLGAVEIKQVTDIC